MKVSILAGMLCMVAFARAQNGPAADSPPEELPPAARKPPPPRPPQPAQINAPPQDESPKPFAYDYSVNDAPTGNVHSHQSSGDGTGAISGQYQLVQSDGSLRVVDYTADALSGFKVSVKKTPNYAPPPPSPPPRP